MKKLIIMFFIVLSVVSFMKIRFFDTHAKIDESMVVDAALNPILSFTGGFYGADFYLEITPKPNTKVYYTLDSSMPDTSKMRYQEPILIQEKWIEATGDEIRIQKGSFTGEPPVPTYPISMIRTGSQKWKSPSEDIFAGTVLKVVAFHDTINTRSEVLTNTYFVHENMHEKYTFPVMSLSADIMDLYSYESGIFVPGLHYDPSISEDAHDNRTGNYYQTGDAWEKEAYIEYYDQSGMLLLSQDAGLRIHGGLSRKYLVKSYRLYARGSGSNDMFSYPFFNDKDVDEFKRIILRGGGQTYEYTLMGEALAQSILKPLSLDIQSFQPVILFVNGEYFGIRNIRDRIDRYYISTHYDIDPDQLTMLTGHGSLEDGDLRGATHYHAMYQYAVTQDLSLKKHYEYIEKRMDIDNFIDYYISELYMANVDWPQNNIIYWRKNVSYNEDAPYGHDGRWRWIVYDLDASFGASWGGYYPEIDIFERLTGDSWKTGKLFYALMANDLFKGKFIHRFHTLLNTVFEENHVLEQVESMIDLYAPEMEEHIARYGYPSSYQNWLFYVNRMKDFAEGRPSTLRMQLKNYFDLGKTHQLTILHDPTKADLYLNQFLQTPQDRYDVDLFDHLPYDIRLIPKQGYRFKGWFDGYGRLLSLNPDASFTIEQNYIIESRFEAYHETLPPDGSYGQEEDILLFGMIGFLSILAITVYIYQKRTKKS
ncbi:MAG: hypothetical protein CVV61_04350 [Tenericutes bacterium HGW-Tenericutes-6]|nr:MAG: hypothetical protein CVV61_04350 [Tenericutes bacterium HGW-Tenericutes-6]